ncbi:hypothetical protein ACFOZ1_06630 [Gracilibacillus marinus]|uniref:Uncharacterized protein n=1 Tax=Gracilibacillus marinus TaxID=630535 RepID=A0ABV8VSQ7_9BACI
MHIYERLHPTAQRVFEKTHVKHINAVGTEERKNYQLNQVKKLKVNADERCIEVYYQNGEWFKYYANGTWG